MDKNIEKIIENMPTIQEAWSFTGMVLHRDENGVETFCREFTVMKNG